MHRYRTPPFAVAGSLAAVGAATLLVYVLRPVAPTLSLGVLYVLAVLATAVVWGLGFAIPVAVLSMLAFNFFFLAPVGTLSLADGRNWTALVVYVLTAIVAGELASRARRRAAEAEQRERESALLADAAAAILQGAALDEILERAENVLQSGEPVARARFEAALASLIALAEERQRVDRLEQSDAIKTAVLQSVSHDLRTPLASIAAAVDGLESSELALDADDRAGLLETIRLEIDRLIRLVGNLLDLSRLQAGAAAPHPALWPVDELITRAVADAHDGERVVVSTRDDLPPTRVDDIQIQRVLANLIENALKFSTSTVQIDAHSDGPSVVVEVIDQGGAGAPGAGLGLAIARGFAGVNGCTLSVEPHGGGTVARLTLPATRLPAGIGA
jgi:two-component system, OmpR family, sensor histidine kinase KdpD